MINIMKADLYRISKSRMFYVSMLICTVSAVVVAVLLRLVETGSVSQETTTSFSLLVDSFIVYFLGAMVIGSQIATDFESKAVHDEVAAGNGRIAIVAAKTISSAVITALLCLPYVLTTIIGFGSGVVFSKFFGIPSVFYNILSNVQGYEADASMIGKCIGICLLVMLIYIARLSILLPIAMKTRKVIPVTVAGIVSSFLFDLLRSLSNGNKAVSSLLDLLPYSCTYDLGMDSTTAQCIKIMICCIVYILIMFGITKIIFQKSEIK